MAASNFFGAVFSRLGTPTMLTNALLSFDLTQIEVLIVVMVLIFILGWPLEWVPIVLIIVPILIPLLDKMEVNLTWFGILVAVNLQTAWLSPPVALSAYFLKGVVPEWDLKDIYIGMMQFMVIQLIGLALIMVFPQIVLCCRATCTASSDGSWRHAGLPEIQVSEGRVVTRASPAAENVVHAITPAEAVRKFEAQGRRAAAPPRRGRRAGQDTTNGELIGELIASTPIPVQVAGGMRTLHHIEAWFETGAAHVVLGTLAITDQQLLAEACARFPGAILANVATKDGYVMIDGWRTQTAYRPQDIVYDLQMAGVAGIIHFDIDRFRGRSLDLARADDGDEPGRRHPRVFERPPCTASTTWPRLRYLPNIHGVIIGEALINERFSPPGGAPGRRPAGDQPGAGGRDLGVGARHPASVEGLPRLLRPLSRGALVEPGSAPGRHRRQSVHRDGDPPGGSGHRSRRAQPPRVAGGVREGGGRRGRGGGGARRHRP